MSDLNAYSDPIIIDDTPANIAAGMMLDFYDLTGILVPEGSIEAALMEVIAEAHFRTRMAVNGHAADVMVKVAQMHGLTPNPATEAVAEVSVTGTPGTYLPAQTLIITNDRAIWELDDELIIPHSGPATGRVSCTLTGPSPGTVVGPAQQVGAITGVDTITVTRVITNGVDGESEWEFLDRARTELGFQSIVPRKPDEYAAYARRHDQVDQARAVNQYRLDTRQSGQAGHITVYVANRNGQALSTETIQQVTQKMNAGTARPLGVRVHVGQPERRTINVQIRVQPNEPDLLQLVKARVKAWASPASWDWTRDDITALDVATAIGDLPGLAGVESITLNGRDRVALTSGGTAYAVPVVTVTVEGG